MSASDAGIGSTTLYNLSGTEDILMSRQNIFLNIKFGIKLHYKM